MGRGGGGAYNGNIFYKRAHITGILRGILENSEKKNPETTTFYRVFAIASNLQYLKMTTNAETK